MARDMEKIHRHVDSVTPTLQLQLLFFALVNTVFFKDDIHCKESFKKFRLGQPNPTPTSFGSAPPLSASEFGAFRHGFFYSVSS
jgi:hypothetical protein